VLTVIVLLRSVPPAYRMVVIGGRRQRLSRIKPMAFALMSEVNTAWKSDPAWVMNSVE
jgi:hypothetical protein